MGLKLSAVPLSFLEAPGENVCLPHPASQGQDSNSQSNVVAQCRQPQICLNGILMILN